MKATAIPAMVLMFAAAAAWGQAPARFDVASVKLLEPGDPNRHSSHTSIAKHPDGARVIMEGVNLMECIQRAYGVAEYQIAGPDWLGSGRYDIAATVTSEVSDEQIRAMLQALLAERFQLSLHRQTRIGLVYELVVAKNGPKIHPVETPGRNNTNTSKGHFTAQSESMANFAEWLWRQTSVPVVDKTGLEGRYDFTIEYAVNDNSPEPPIPLAVQQLGLKLEPAKGPIEMLVIDRVERVPTAN